MWLGSLLVGLICGLYDARRGTVPNQVTYSAILMAPVFHLSVGGSQAFFISVIGLLLLGGPAVFLWYRSNGKFRGGDVKMLAAYGAILGPFHGMIAQLVGSVAAAGYGFLRYRLSGSADGKVWVRLGPWFALGILAAFARALVLDSIHFPSILWAHL